MPLFGPRLLATIGWLKSVGHLSYSTVAAWMDALEIVASGELFDRKFRRHPRHVVEHADTFLLGDPAGGETLPGKARHEGFDDIERGRRCRPEQAHQREPRGPPECSAGEQIRPGFEGSRAAEHCDFSASPLPVDGGVREHSGQPTLAGARRISRANACHLGAGPATHR